MLLYFLRPALSILWYLNASLSSVVMLNEGASCLLWEESWIELSKITKHRKKKHPLLAEPSLDVELMGDSSDAFGITQIHLRVFIYW